MLGKEILGYHVDEEIGSGGFGTVYKVSKTNASGTYVRALKHITLPTKKQYTNVLNSMGGDYSKADDYFADILKDIVSEIRILSILSESGNQNIVRYYENDIVETPSPKTYDIYILMEYLTPFSDHLEKEALTVRDVIKLGKDLLNALISCHGRNIIHRDIKDDNIFVSADGTYKLGDFGVSKALKDQSRAASIKGTPNFIAPEVYLGKDNYDNTVDLYSLGIVLYRLLNKLRNPFMPAYPAPYTTEDEDLAFEARMIGKTAELPIMAQNELGKVILKAIMPRSERYNTAKEFLIDLEIAEKKLSEDDLSISIGLFNMPPRKEITPESFSHFQNDMTLGTPIFQAKSETHSNFGDRHLFDTMASSSTVVEETPQKTSKKEENKKKRSKTIVVSIIISILIVSILCLAIAFSQKMFEKDSGDTDDTQIPGSSLQDGESTGSENDNTVTNPDNDTDTDSPDDSSDTNKPDNETQGGNTGEVVEPTNPTFVFALNEDKNGYVLTGVSNDFSEESVTIPATYNDLPIVKIADSAFTSNNTISSVIISNGIKEIGDWAFGNCGELTNIVLPNTVTDIGEYAFYNCALTNIEIPNSVKVIGRRAFQSCDELSTIIINSSSQLESIGEGAFYYCIKIESITIPKTINAIGENAFEDCDKLSKVYIYDLEKWCKIDFQNEYSNPMHYADNLYLNGKALFGDVVLPSGITVIPEGTFKNATAVMSVSIPEGVTTIGASAFENCDGIYELTLPTSVAKIGAYAFGGCDNITKVYISDLEKWCLIDFCDTYYSNPMSLLTTENLYLNGSVISGNFTLPNGIKAIPNGTFKNSLITSVTIPNTVEHIGFMAFSYCTGLTTLTIPNGVKSIGTHVTWGCTGITSLTISESVNSIDHRAFANCIALNTILVDSNNATYHSTNNCLIETQTKTLIQGCITSEIPKDGSVIHIGNNAFEACRNLTTIEIPVGIISIGDEAFYACSQLSDLIIPNTVVNIGSRAFWACYGIDDLIIPASVVKIAPEAFGFGNIETVTFQVVEGWRVSSSNATGGTSLSAEELSDKALAATYLTSTYCEFYWYKS